MDKKQIAKIIREMGIMLEISGENPFKVRAHENAARIIEGLSEDLDSLVESGSLINIKGIGEAMAKKVETLLNTGKLSAYEKLKSSIPPGLMDMLQIQGFGPKKIKAVWENLGVTSVDELEKAGSENKLADLPGFGKKTQEKILANIELNRKFSERHRISEAREIAQKLYEDLIDFPGVIRCEIAGSLRRWRETIKDIDLLVSANDNDGTKIMDHFTNLSEVVSVTGKGDTKSGVILTNGMNADLRIVTDLQFPYALHHSTGSMEHNTAMRQYAKKIGLKMNEYGLFREDEKNILCKNEEEIFKTLKMKYIPPELRENMGEIEAARKNELPKLIELKDIRGIIHVHSNYSDGLNSIEEMARGCHNLGYEYLVICDHSKSSFYANGLQEERIKKQHVEIDEINHTFKNFRVVKGIECDILPNGNLDYSDEILATFEVVVVSVHSNLGMDEKTATNRVLKAIQNPFVTILAHPTGRLLLKREGYPLNHQEVISVAAELGVSIEINAHPQRLDLDWRYAKYAKEKGAKISINPDAHRIEGYEDMIYGIGIARKGWLSKEDVLNTGSVENLLKFAQHRRR
jgi:DNA polymerase (family 10)